MTDASFPCVALLWSADGTDAATGPFTDTTGKTLTAVGNAQLDTAQFKFGTASALFDGTGDAITTPTVTMFDFDAGDFTIELWARFNNTGVSADIFARRATSVAFGAWTIRHATTALSCYFSSAGTAWDIADTKAIGTVATGQWYHIAITRSGTTFRAYLNGVQGSTWESSAAIYIDASALSIGGNADASGSFNGWIDEIRLTKGVARYTGAGSFTPPSSAFDTSGPAIAGAATFGAMAAAAIAVYAAPSMTAMTASGSSYFGNAAASFEEMTAEAEGVGGAVISMGLRAPVPTLTAPSLLGMVATAALRAPAPVLVAVNFSPALIDIVGAAPLPRLAAVMLGGSVIVVSLEAPAPTLVMSGYPPYIITASLRAPAPYLDAELLAAITAAFRTWVLNTRKGALSEYGPEFEFNSFAHFNRQVLACGPSGIVVLGTQDLDGTDVITARARTGNESFESSYHKRVPRIYTSGTYAGDMLFRTITENSERTYSLPFNGITRLQQRRVPVGKGPKSRFWAFEIENVGGSDFGVNDILVYPTKLRRRVQ